MATVENRVATLNVAGVGNLLFPGIEKKEAVAKRPTALEEAFIAGQKLIQY